ncbi:hypothetical protein [Dactylosporangium sp. CA-233914]|uniref:hypothetical protein n=1 Tax=Dactylosporangium sp. CA-233914 TaxID=3239934 RepID=UPI003D94C09C
MFYQSPDILITNTHVVVLYPDPARFDLAGIQAPYIVRHGRGAGFRAGYEIRARYGAADVRLFHTTDRAAFGAVRRALIRALEYCGDPLPI